MTRDEHNAIIQQLHGMIAPEHIADATGLLTNLSNDYSETLTTSEASTANVERLTTEIDKLLRANGRLFMQVGQTKESQQTEAAQEAASEPTEPMLTFENLFNEKGELK